MSDSQPLSLPSPKAQANESQADDGGQQSQSNSSSGFRVPTLQQCLEMLARLPGLVTLDVIRPAQANVIRGTIRDLMAHHMRASGSQVGAGVDHRLLDLLPGNAGLMNLITPFLSQEQVDLVVKGATDGGSSQT